MVGLSFLACDATDTRQHLNNPMTGSTQAKTYLALGDSYTIGEGVNEAARYPNQLILKLNEERPSSWENAEIIAKTGWTVAELQEGIDQTAPAGAPYDLVTLLIGVNDQYRGGSPDTFRGEFEQLLVRALKFAGDQPKHLIVLSIPDWGITPFAANQGADPTQIAAAIDSFNQAKEEICSKYGVPFVSITEDYRTTGAQAEMLAEDQLHPSEKVYDHWSDRLLELVRTLQ